MTYFSGGGVRRLAQGGEPGLVCVFFGGQTPGTGERGGIGPTSKRPGSQLGGEGGRRGGGGGEGGAGVTTGQLVTRNPNRGVFVFPLCACICMVCAVADLRAVVENKRCRKKDEIVVRLERCAGWEEVKYGLHKDKGWLLEVGRAGQGGGGTTAAINMPHGKRPSGGKRGVISEKTTYGRPPPQAAGRASRLPARVASRRSSGARIEYTFAMHQQLSPPPPQPHTRMAPSPCPPIRQGVDFVPSDGWHKRVEKSSGRGDFRAAR